MTKKTPDDNGMYKRGKSHCLTCHKDHDDFCISRKPTECSEKCGVWYYEQIVKSQPIPSVLDEKPIPDWEIELRTKFLENDSPEFTSEELINFIKSNFISKTELREVINTGVKKYQKHMSKDCEMFVGCENCNRSLALQDLLKELKI